MMSLDGKIAVVTGASSGIGQAIAVAYAQQGARVVVADITDATETLNMIKKVPGKGIAVSCDVSSQASVQNLVREVEAKFGTIGILVNNAGIFPFCPIENLTEELWDQVMNINAKGTFLCSKAVLPGMKKLGGGKIINIASGSFFVGIPQAGAYVASKGAVIGLSRVMARELGPDNIRVNVITPGVIKTAGTLTGGLPESFFQSFVAQQCVGRSGQPDDLVGAALFLASDSSNFVSGQIINVDGGFVTY